MLCGRHTSLGGCRLSMLLSWDTGALLQPVSEHCQGMDRSQHRSGKGLTTTEKLLAIDSTHKARALGRLRPALSGAGQRAGSSPLAWSAGASAAESTLSGQWGAAPRTVQPIQWIWCLVLLCQGVFPKKKSVLNTCECLKGRERTVKGKTQGCQCSEAVRNCVIGRGHLSGRQKWSEKGKLAVPCMMSSFIIDTLPQSSWQSVEVKNLFSAVRNLLQEKLKAVSQSQRNLSKQHNSRFHEFSRCSSQEKAGRGNYKKSALYSASEDSSCRGKLLCKA